MPKAAEIEVFNVARTAVDVYAVRAWLDRLGVDESFSADSEEHEISDPAFLIAVAAKQCYLSFQPGLNPNVTKIRSDWVQYFDNILASGHGSVLEHATYSYAIEGLTRVATAELNRHRAGWAISERSLRYCRFEEIPFWMPTCFRDAPGDDRELSLRKSQSRIVLWQSFANDERSYAELMKIWDMDETDKNFYHKKTVTSAARRIVGMGVATGGVWTGNLRALRHVIALRTDPAAEEEISCVFTMIARDICGKEPLLFGDFTQQNATGPIVPAYRKV
jgi:thymidylate synthase (FAD)